MAKIIPLLFMRRESLRKARGWWSPTHGGTHVKRMPVRDHGGAPGHRYRDGAILQVLPNPQNAGRVLLVSALKRTQKGKHYVAAVEVERHHDALYLTTFMTMPERTLRQALALMANWQEGQRPPSG